MTADSPTPAAATPAQGAQVLDLAEAEKALSLPQLLKVISERYSKPLQSIVTDICHRGRTQMRGACHPVATWDRSHWRGCC